MLPKYVVFHNELTEKNIEEIKNLSIWSII
jgi:hypothetical protein